MKLGKLAPRFDIRTLRLANYLNPIRLPTPPESLDYSAEIDRELGSRWEMFANDRIGDCAIAAPAHQQMAWSAAVKDQPNLFIPTEQQVIADYMAVSGYNPADPSTDRGCVYLDVMNYWRLKGIAGKKIWAYAAVNPQDHVTVAVAIWLFGGLQAGFSMPIAWQSMEDWLAPSGFHQQGKWAPGSWGGHAVPLIGYSPTRLRMVTWGAEKLVSWNALSKYCDELYVALDESWFDDTRKAPNGFDLDRLAKDLQALINPTPWTPPPAPVPVPPTPPVPVPPVPPAPLPPPDNGETTEVTMVNEGKTYKGTLRRV